MNISIADINMLYMFLINLINLELLNDLEKYRQSVITKDLNANKKIGLIGIITFVLINHWHVLI